MGLGYFCPLNGYNLTEVVSSSIELVHWDTYLEDLWALVRFTSLA